MPVTNLLIALKNIIQNPVVDLTSANISSNRINNVGEGLEIYIKNAFSGTFNIDNEIQKQETFANNFSYLGNQNNPPDIIIKGGDAIEVKKLESSNSAIALNSSYPKDKLYANSPMITEACRNCEEWVEKDLLYSIGVANNKILKSLWFVYGDCYSAKEEVYEKAFEEIQNIKESSVQIDFICKKIDLLDITKYSSKEGWIIQNPNEVFNYLENIDKFDINCLMLLEKYSSFPIENTMEIQSDDKIKIRNVMIKNPNNPAELLSAKLIQANFAS